MKDLKRHTGREQSFPVFSLTACGNSCEISTSFSTSPLRLRFCLIFQPVSSCFFVLLLLLFFVFLISVLCPRSSVIYGDGRTDSVHVTNHDTGSDALVRF